VKLYLWLLLTARDGNDVVLPSNQHTAQLLLHEAKFYQLTGLTELLSQLKTSAADADQPSRQQQQQQPAAASSRGHPGSAACTAASLAKDAAVDSSTGGPLLPLPPNSSNAVAASAAGAGGGGGSSGLAEAVAAAALSREVHGPLRSKAQELAGMLLKVWP
jgi:hypothetical protein